MTEPWQYRPHHRGVMERLTSNPVWYDGRQVMRRNGRVNILFGGRGTGKSFFFKVWTLLCARGETVWMRRYEDEIPEVISTFASDIRAAGYLEGRELEIDRNTLLLDGRPRIHFAGLSICNKRKSTSYPEVNWLIFDEFVEERRNRSYLPGETELFMNYLTTLNRFRGARRPVRAFLIGNKFSWFNDYTLRFGIEPFEGRFKVLPWGDVVVENYRNPAFEEFALSDPHGQFLERQGMGDFAIRNVSLRDSSHFLRRRPKESTPWASVRLEGRTYGIWQDGEGMYFSRQHDPSRMTFAPGDDLREGEFCLKTPEPPVSILRMYHEKGWLWYDDGGCKTAAMKLITETWK